MPVGLVSSIVATVCQVPARRLSTDEVIPLLVDCVDAVGDGDGPRESGETGDRELTRPRRIALDDDDLALLSNDVSPGSRSERLRVLLGGAGAFADETADAIPAAGSARGFAAGAATPRVARAEDQEVRDLGLGDQRRRRLGHRDQRLGLRNGVVIAPSAVQDRRVQAVEQRVKRVQLDGIRLRVDPVAHGRRGSDRRDYRARAA